MASIFFWIFFSLVLLTVCPDSQQARYDIAKRQAQARGESRRKTRAPSTTRSQS
jgi:hypothetical protein